MEKRDRSEVIMVRVSAEDKKAFEEPAEKLDMKLSEFLRAATLLYLAITVNRHGLKLRALPRVSLIPCKRPWKNCASRG